MKRSFLLFKFFFEYFSSNKCLITVLKILSDFSMSPIKLYKSFFQISIDLHLSTTVNLPDQNFSVTFQHINYNSETDISQFLVTEWTDFVIFISWYCLKIKGVAPCENVSSAILLPFSLVAVWKWTTILIDTS